MQFGSGWVEGYCRSGVVAWPWDRSGPGVYRCPFCLLVCRAVRRRTELAIPLVSELMYCRLSHWQVRKKQKQTPGCSMRFTFVQHTNGTHTSNWPVWWACLRSGGGTNCAWARNEVSVWMQGVGEDGSCRGDRTLFVPHPPPPPTAKRPQTYFGYKYLFDCKEVCTPWTWQWPWTHTQPSSIRCISKLIWLSGEVKQIKVLDGTQLWHNLCAMYKQPQPWVFRFLIPERD